MAKFLNWQRGRQNVGLVFHLCYRTVTQPQINSSRQYRLSRFNSLHQFISSVAQPERLAILWNTKLDLHQRIRLLLFATITNFLYQPILRHCLEIICRTIEKSGLDFRTRQKTFLHRFQNLSGANSCCQRLPGSLSHKVQCLGVRLTAQLLLPSSRIRGAVQSLLPTPLWYLFL